ncbi:hypothetical protein CBR_g335 [Chara braunii]|uniref:Uncharacterized protein n=1 Tax=Chara braunii TaxID=69332 RepID=A0A388JQD7_CHABU|nr:hypothetical protein CBR_g335 [Chara braunii]|eukprot:GBG60005.1 hypothetical protein CBR_g335 [Chara braunii]
MIEQDESCAEGKENIQSSQEVGRGAEGSGIHGGGCVQRGRERDACELVDERQRARWGTRGGGNGRGDNKMVMDGRPQNVLSRQGSAGPENTSVPDVTIRPDAGKVGATSGTSHQANLAVDRAVKKTVAEPAPSLPSSNMVFIIKQMDQKEHFVLDTDAYHPLEPLAADRDPFLTQCPPQAARLAAGNRTQSRQFSKSDISMAEEINQGRAVSSAASAWQPKVRENHPSGDGQSGGVHAKDVQAEHRTTTAPLSAGDDGPARSTKGGRGAGKGSLSHLMTHRKPSASG